MYCSLGKRDSHQVDHWSLRVLEKYSTETGLQEYSAEFNRLREDVQTDDITSNAITYISTLAMTTTTKTKTVAAANNRLATILIFKGFIYVRVTGLVAIYALIFFLYKRKKARTRTCSWLLAVCIRRPTLWSSGPCLCSWDCVTK